MTIRFRQVDAGARRRRMRRAAISSAARPGRSPACGARLDVAAGFRRHHRGLRRLSRDRRAARRASKTETRRRASPGWKRRPAASFGRGPRPLLVSVRSGAPVSMPGMMDTVLNLGINDETEAALAAECGDARFRARHAPPLPRSLCAYRPEDGRSPSSTRPAIRRTGARRSPPPAALRFPTTRASSCAARCARCSNPGIRAAPAAIASTTASRTTLGTAVTVQAMVFGNLDDALRHGRAVLAQSARPASRRPTANICRARKARTSSPASSRRSRCRQLRDDSCPQAHAGAPGGGAQLEAAARDVQDIEFTVERGRSISCSRARPSSPRMRRCASPSIWCARA